MISHPNRNRKAADIETVVFLPVFGLETAAPEVAKDRGLARVFQHDKKRNIRRSRLYADGHSGFSHHLRWEPGDWSKLIAQYDTDPRWSRVVGDDAVKIIELAYPTT